MNLFPNLEAKLFSACVHGEYIHFPFRTEYHSGICIEDEEGKKYVLTLNGPGEDWKYVLLKFSLEQEVMSVGHDLTLQPQTPLISVSRAYNQQGALIQSSEGTYLLGKEDQSGYYEEVIVRIDKPGVRGLGNRPNGGFSFASWSISIFGGPLRVDLPLADFSFPSEE